MAVPAAAVEGRRGGRHWSSGVHGVRDPLDVVVVQTVLRLGLQNTGLVEMGSWVFVAAAVVLAPDRGRMNGLQAPESHALILGYIVGILESRADHEGAGTVMDGGTAATIVDLEGPERAHMIVESEGVVAVASWAWHWRDWSMVVVAETAKGYAGEFPTIGKATASSLRPSS